MKAIGLFEYGGPDVLSFVTVPDPVPGPGDLLVRVRAAGVNPVDAKVRHGVLGARPPAGGPLIVGWDAAGVVEATGKDCRRFQRGDEVYFAGDIGRPGSYAELVAVDERIVARKPRSLGFPEAAAIPLVAITAWESLVENLGIRGGVGAGRSILIVGGAGGVGSLAIQIAKQVCGMRVVATASRPESAEHCKKLGAEAVIAHGEDLVALLKERGFSGVDYIHSNAERNDFQALGAALNPLGKISCILPADAADLRGLFSKRGSVHFESMFCRPRFDVEPDKQGALLDRVAELLERKTLVSPTSRVLDWSEFRAAHEAIETAHTVGKIVLRVTA